MNFHLLDHPHPHPLIFIEEGKNDGEIISCSRCNIVLNPPAFSCSVCNFHVHQSCIELPSMIQTQFHPQHSLNLTTNNYLCNCCGLMPSGQTYLCFTCGFQIGIKCALLDTKQSGLHPKSDNEFRHFSHPHPLILQQDIGQKNDYGVCLVCELLITSGSGSVYFCSQCDSHFHKDCAELPREIQNHDYHPHPLLLLPQPFTHNTYCDSCKNQCTEFIYSCPKCNFNLHISCLQSNSNHKHTFTKFRTEIQFVCQACGKDGKGFSWFCINCHLLVHKECSQLPLILRTYGHRLHNLSLTYFRNPVDLPDKILCKICNEEVGQRYAGYGCYQCSYFAHLGCARRQCIDPQSLIDALDSPTDHIIVVDGQVRHFSHKHNLSCSDDEELELDKHCNGCMKRLSSPSYGCKECDFFLHEDCVKLPRKKGHSLHQHPLALISIPDCTFQCNACLEYFHGFAYHCEKCRFILDIRCASINIPFIHSSHEHTLSLYLSTNEEQNCDGCGQGVKNKTVFRCIDCNFYLDLRCATLPIAVRYRFDMHPLKLTFVDEEEENQGCEYYCDVCEEERDPEVWFYSCKMCCFVAHPGCVIGEFPYLKLGMCEGHSHPLRLVMKNKNKKTGYFHSDVCANCDKSCGENFVYECGRCKFSVHGIGACYHRQLVQGKLTFTTRCFYSPAIGLYEHPIQNQINGQMQIRSLGLYGGKGGNPWKENVFLKIRQLVINHDKWIYAIQIQYEQNGNSIWSAKHGGYEGLRSEVILDYPDEHLVSMKGYYGDLRNWGIGCTVIRSLTFVTNRRSHGPFGVEQGTKFSFPENGDRVKIFGFYGSSGHFLDSIGLQGSFHSK